MEVEVETGAGCQADRPIFSVGARLCICNVGRRVETSSVDGCEGREGGRPGCDRPPWPPRPQYWNIDTTSLYAAFAERTACFFRPSALRRLRFGYRSVLRQKAIEKSGPTYLYLAWRFARRTLYPSVSRPQDGRGVDRTTADIGADLEREGERHTREQRVSREIDKKEVDGCMNGGRTPKSIISVRHKSRSPAIFRRRERGFSITPFFPSLHRPPPASISREDRRSSARSLTQSRHVGAGCGPPQSLHLILRPSAAAIPT